jgi:hypothetical protein
MNPQYPKFSRHITGTEYQKRKLDHRQGRHTNIDLKTLCHERGLSTKGTKRELKSRLGNDDRGSEQLRREAKLKVLMEDEFKKTRSTDIEGLGFALIKLEVKGGRKRSSTYPPTGFKITSRQARKAHVQTKFADLSIADEQKSGKSNDMEVERKPQVVLAKHLPLRNATSSVEDTVSRQFNR